MKKRYRHRNRRGKFRNPAKRRAVMIGVLIVTVVVLRALILLLFGEFMPSGIPDAAFDGRYPLPDYIETADKGYFDWPAPELHNITSKFVPSRKHPIKGMTRPHYGVDISGKNAMGSPVTAIDGGVVIQVQQRGGERGINIRVQHDIEGDVWVSRYQHLSLATVYEGQIVSRGAVIGNVGNTGMGTGPHLHLELTYNGVLVDPLPLLGDRQ